VNYLTPALQAVEGDAESQFVTFAVPADLLRPGSNVLAVEVHQSAADLLQPAQPAAYWSFNHPVFPWHDHLGTNDFAPVGGNVVIGPGRFGGGASNSASATGYLMAADSSELDYSGPFTVGGWFAFGAGTANRAVGLEKTGEFSLYYTGASLNRYRFELNGVYVQDPTSGTVAGQWRFVVGWFDGTNINIQVDNGVVSSAPANPPRPTSSPLVALHLAQSSGGISADELFLYKRVLSASERTAHFQNQLGLNPSDLKFDFGLTAIAGQLPQLLSGPASLVRRAGENAAFTASAVSATPLTYQWYFKGAPLVGATSSLLFLGGVGPAQMGNYSVTIRNAAGEVTPPPAMLTVVQAPALRAVLAANGQGCVLGIPGSGVPGAIFVSSNLVDWSELVRLPALLTPTNIVDTGALNAPSRFYRLRLDW
ncbi:MAG TPA: LamG-like jellyroll fold domain-containing protein, partial [Verrucomicrobiae bacterium]